ncbi:MAG: tRNA (adenosine(37)-N6)-dimethylallyltransferase MiaA [Candidatus Cloacimonetes bacterium]|jgi:tRNA dimethylallyltransferase|nr:tRNA (adenosine(37)-N6)-dimethylallyltransferase MiaA [Candidatus Cloacimonadota bacterium]MDY0336965.1 tRNA (adenosine(37)-N6)-dimethylallyltransferase MiaA [Candidatus Cloacimonadaceae bacterium]
MIITIEGPTGAGKSAIALELAKALNSDIISCDSRQIYRYLDIGTAKPGQSELEQIKHHLIDIIEPNQSYNAGLFCRDASQIIDRLQADDRIPILCGGTGLYIRSLLDGLFEHPRIDPSIRSMLLERLQLEGADALFNELMQIDPDFAAKISPNDPQRILRGLEVYLGTGRTITEHWANQNKQKRYSAFRILISPDRETLYLRINQRLQQMLANGLIEEIHAVLARGYSWRDPGLNSLGYKEFQAYFESSTDIDSCASLAAQHHRNYAKRQMTWYRKVTFDLTCDAACFNLFDVLRAIKA